MAELELFLADAEDGAAFLSEGLPTQSLAAASAQRGPLSYRAPDLEPNSLYNQGWGVVATDDARGRALVERIRPLIDKRAQEQQMPVRVMWAPPGVAGTDARAWVSKTLDDPTLDAMDIPAYLLMLGDLDEQSVDLQRTLAEDSYVGRLAFDQDEHYEAYVEKLLRWEAAPAPEPHGRAVFATARDGSRATELALTALMQPSLSDARRFLDKLALDDPRHPFPASRVEELVIEGPGSPDALLAPTRADTPTLLFSVSHGAGAPRRGWPSEDHRRAEQGALCLGGGNLLTGEQVASGSFLPGGLWMMFACYGAGTPGHGESAFHRWLIRLKEQGGFGGRASFVLRGLPQEGERPFIAALPKAALSNPSGPLAVVGHLDLAWSYSFQQLGARTVDRYKRWQPVLGALAAGSRAGVALKELLRHAAKEDRTTAELMDLAEKLRQEGQEVDEAALMDGNRWMTRQDIGGYVLLGDPAAYLPVAAARARGADAPYAAPLDGPTISLDASTAAPTTQQSSTLQQSDSVAPAAREAAVLDALLAERVAGEGTRAAVAEKHGVSEAELGAWVQRWREAGRAALS